LRICQQSADQLPWFHIVSLLTKIPTPPLANGTPSKPSNEGWSRPILDSHIQSQLHLRQGGAPSAAGPTRRRRVESPYLFDLLGLGDDAHERDINALELCS
jgi:hypothetical protein